jgi:peptide subunit release factor 1 (eRF1)
MGTESKSPEVLGVKDVLPPKEWYRINRFLKELERATPPVVSVYAPPGEIKAMAELLAKTEREPIVEEVETAIEKELGGLKGPEGSVCIFGWKEGESVVLEKTLVAPVIPPVYLVDEKPYTEPLHDILEIKYDVLLVLLDHEKAILRSYKGSEVLKQKIVRSYVGAKHRKGGWSQKRFSRIRDLQIKHHLDKVKDHLKKFDLKSIELILLAGPGNAKKEFAREHLNAELAGKVTIVEGLVFSSSDGEINDAIIGSLDKYRKGVEMRQLRTVEENVGRGLAITENREIRQALEVGAVETILIASDYYAATPEENEGVLNMIEMAESTAAEIEFITNEEILEKLHRHGSVVATLRYRPF